ncbi:hypothetical protein Tsubulata_013386 [Turnera subulata]|uniref:DUF4283 domain-containing protein n=1 Tax=Turnera subulata TaxID=218843 RepID=A0A9Q0G387_9ROSI|nr:hypothetical protein Tsubulata_013386 [Turnera subulata]
MATSPTELGHDHSDSGERPPDPILELFSDDDEAMSCVSPILVGAVFAHFRRFSAKAIGEALNRAWSLTTPVEIKEVKNNVYVFTFASVAEKDRILQSSPWNFSGPPELRLADQRVVTRPGRIQGQKLTPKAAKSKRPIKLLLESNRTRTRTNIQPPCFEEHWYRDAECEDIIREVWSSGAQILSVSAINCRLADTLNRLCLWNTTTYGNIPQQVIQVRQDLAILDTRRPSQAVIIRKKELLSKLDNLLERDEIIWRQRSRALWLECGDSNSSFFHRKANQ